MIVKNKIAWYGRFLTSVIIVMGTSLTAPVFAAAAGGPGKTPNIVVIVMDTVRQDHLSCYGYSRNTSPNLVKLSKESRMFNNAYSTSGWTPPAHASLFTGLFAASHKATQENFVLGDDATTIAEVLSDHGYETFGISENPMVSRGTNFSQGFSTYDETWRNKNKKSRENPAYKCFKNILEKRDKQKPFFLFINFIEPHSPYNSSRQFLNRFVSDRSIKVFSHMLVHYYTGKKVFTPAEMNHLKELYDAEIFYVDHVIGKIIDDLKRESLWEETVFIVTSDHGENFGEHQLMAHVFSLHQALIKIPLLIHYPAFFPPGSKEDKPVQLTDIFPTLLGLAGIDQKKYPNQGRDLLKTKLRDDYAVFSEYYYPDQVLRVFGKKGNDHAALAKYKRRIKSVISGNFKLIWGSDKKHELYDLKKDPTETTNLVNDRELSKQKSESLKLLVRTYHKYNGFLNIRPGKRKGKLDKKSRERLKTLGYIK